MLIAPNLETERVSQERFRWAEEFLFILKASRPGFWLTAIWFYLLPLAQRPVLGTFDFWFGLAFVSFAFGVSLAGMLMGLGDGEWLFSVI